MGSYLNVRRAQASVAMILFGAGLFFGLPANAADPLGTMQGQNSSGPERTRPDETIIHGDINLGIRATDVGDAWFKRYHRPAPSTGEYLNVDLEMNEGVTVTSVEACLSFVPYKFDYKYCDNPIKGKVPGAGNELEIVVPDILVGKDIYANVRVGIDGDYGYANFNQWFPGYHWGNTKVPPLGYTGPRDICPVATGQLLNHQLFLDGQQVDSLFDMPANSTVTVKFTMAAGCTDKRASISYWFRPPGNVTLENIPQQKLAFGDFADFTQAADVQEYKLYGVRFKHQDNCLYQIDLAAGDIDDPPFFKLSDTTAIAEYAGGGKIDCRNGVPTTTTSTTVKPTTTLKPTTTTTVKPTTTTTKKPTTTTSHKPTTTTSHKPTTTTTEAPTTTTTLAPTTTTTLAPTTTTSTTVGPTVLPTVLTTSTTQGVQVLGTQEESLPKTGGEVAGLALMGIGSLTGGSVISEYVRRRKRAGK